MKPVVKNIEASVRGRLQDKGRKTNRPFAEILQYYGMERFLYRFAQSEYAKSFILKGALMFTVWNVPARRTTVDIDFLARFDNQIEKVEQVIRNVCTVKVPTDGLIFDSKTVRGQHIKEDADYEGVRVKFMGFLEKTKIPMQIDVGFGDVIIPRPSAVDYPTILDFPAPHLQGYTIESVIAEKFEAMVKLGTLNSRMKDFYDIWLMTRQFSFEEKQLAAAIKATFENRKTPVPSGNPFFAAEIYSDESVQATLWKAFLKKNDVNTAPDSFKAVVSAVEEFLGKPIAAITAGKV
jgi:predicted nucleotidyltransferase component of viral defense system